MIVDSILCSFENGSLGSFGMVLSEVTASSRIAIVGPNGSGKSTLLPGTHKAMRKRPEVTDLGRVEALFERFS